MTRADSRRTTHAVEPRTTYADARWDGLTAGLIAERCRLPNVELLDVTDSTLDVAHSLAERGAPAGSLIVADAQRAGRGRFGRSWTSQPGRGVWCTMIERPRDVSALHVLSLRVGLCAAEALDAFAPPADRVGVKWPNDLTLRGGKLGGILVEARWSGSVLAWVAIGIGVNVREPEGVHGAAGLRAGTQRFDVLTAIVDAIRSAAASTGELSHDEIDRYRARDVLVGREVASPARGCVVGIAPAGALLGETSGGVQHHRGGTVRFAGDK